MFTAVLFIRVTTRKPRKCPSVGERRHRLWYIHTMEYYSAAKRNEVPAPATVWPSLDNMAPCGKGRTKEPQGTCFPLHEMCRQAIPEDGK